MRLASHLKSETSTAHAAVEAVLGAWLSGLTRARYIDLLRRLLDFIQPWEAARDRALPRACSAFFENRRHTDRLLADLHILGAAHGPRPARLPVLDRAAAALGSSYVIEGSMLGARQISRIIGSTIGVGAGTGGNYFAGHGRHTARRWRAMRALLDRHVPGDQYACAVAAARDTFECVRESLLATAGAAR